MTKVRKKGARALMAAQGCLCSLFTHVRIMPDLSSNPEVIGLLQRTLKLLNRNDLESLVGLLREDAAVSSPFLSDDQDAPHVFHGREEILDHFRAAHDEFSKFRVQDVFSDGLVYKILLSDDQRRIVLVIEPDSSALEIRRFHICPSLLSKLWVQPEQQPGFGMPD